jgi:hypothetical protein
VDAPFLQNTMGENVTMFMTQLDNSRAYRNCELVFDYGEEFGFDIYSTSPLDECNLTWWDNLDMDALATEFNATSITKNGPESWAMDQVMMMGSIESPTNMAGELMMLVLMEYLPQYLSRAPALVKNSWTRRLG